MPRRWLRWAVPLAALPAALILLVAFHGEARLHAASLLGGVIGIMVAVALKSSGSLFDTARTEETKEELEALTFAIAGNPDQPAAGVEPTGKPSSKFPGADVRGCIVGIVNPHVYSHKTSDS